MGTKKESSAKLRVTLRIAALVGFEYCAGLYKFGGVFNTLQLEQIEAKLKEAEALKRTAPV